MAKELKGTKHIVTAKSLENLKKGTPFSVNDVERARECNKKSLEKRKENKEKYYTREEARAEIFKEILKQDKITQAISEMSPRELIELLKTVLPPEKITQEIIVSLGIEKVFITKEENQQVQKHIDDFIES